MMTSRTLEYYNQRMREKRDELNALDELNTNEDGPDEDNWSDNEESKPAALIISSQKEIELKKKEENSNLRITELQNQIRIGKEEKLTYQTQLQTSQKENQRLLQEQQSLQSNIQILTTQLQQTKTASLEIKNEFIKLQEKHTGSHWKNWLAASILSFLGSTGAIAAKLLFITTISILSGPIGLGILALGTVIGLGCAFKARQNYIVMQEHDAALKKVMTLDLPDITQSKEPAPQIGNQFINQLHLSQSRVVHSSPATSPAILNTTPSSPLIVQTSPAKNESSGINDRLNDSSATFSPR